ncbi:uncharacterized protein [Dendrobates tinctorius]|uniref:uncharacterized protein isoform X2 n=1 Tax=Dendrobates tinctorius TaxID=92724 RepID=UPI003CCA0A81
MVWDQTRSLMLMIIVHVATCQTFKANCSNEICSCGESVTITCDLNAPLVNIRVKNEDNVKNEDDNTALPIDFLTKKLKHEKISIEWTDFKVTVTISEVTFSDAHKYLMTLMTNSGNEQIYIINFNVCGMCDPKISKILETKEHVCEAESKSNLSIIWWNNHRYLNTERNESKKLAQGYKLRSTLKLSEEIEMEDNQICCAASDGIHKEKEVCVVTPAKLSTINNENSTVAIVAIFLVVALVAAALGYLIKRRNRIVIREVPGEENPAIPPLLQPPTV